MPASNATEHYRQPLCESGDHFLPIAGDSTNHRRMAGAPGLALGRIFGGGFLIMTIPNQTPELHFGRINRWAQAAAARMEESHLPIVEPTLALMDSTPPIACWMGLRKRWLVRRLAARVPNGLAVGIDVSIDGPGRNSRAPGCQRPLPPRNRRRESPRRQTVTKVCPRIRPNGTPAAASPKYVAVHYRGFRGDFDQHYATTPMSPRNSISKFPPISSLPQNGRTLPRGRFCK